MRTCLFALTLGALGLTLSACSDKPFDPEPPAIDPDEDIAVLQ